MSVRLSRSGCIAALVLLCWAAAVVCRAEDQENKAPSAPPAPAATAAPAQTAPKVDGLQQLEDELRRALRSLAPKSDPGANLAPAYQPPVVIVPDKRTRDEQERRKNWMLPESDKDQSASADQDWMNSPGNSTDAKTKKRTALDDFYERLGEGSSHRLLPRASDSGGLTPTRSGQTGGSDSRDDSRLPTGIRDSARQLQDLLSGSRRGDDNSTPAGSWGLSSLFGRNDRDMSPDDLKAHKAYMDQYRRVLNGDGPAPSAGFNPLATLGQGSPASLPAAPGAFDPFNGASRPRSLDSTPGMLPTIRNPGTLPDPNAAPLNQWNPLYAPPKVEPPKPAPLAVPPAEAPRRRF